MTLPLRNDLNTLLVVEEIRNHLWQMLESGAIRPSQSAWCNAVVLVQKKDGGLQFCIDLCCLNAHMKKDSYPLPRIQEVSESLVGAGHFSCLDLKSGFWQIKMEEASKQYTTFTVGNLGFFECNCMPFGLCNMPVTFQWPYAKLPGWVEPHLLPDLLRWLDHVLTECEEAPPPIACHDWLTQGV